MPILDRLKSDTLDPTGQVLEYKLTELYSQYVLNGSGTLSGNVTVRQRAADQVTTGLTYPIRYEGNFVYAGGSVVTIFGRALTQLEAQSELFITAQYLSGAWDVNVEFVAAKVTQEKIIPSGGGTVTADESVFDYVLTGAGTLTSSYTLALPSFSEAPTVPMQFTAAYNAAWTLDGNQITIFGIALTANQALSGRTLVVATCTVPAPNVQVWQTLVIEDDNLVRTNKGVETYAWNGGANTIQLNSNVDKVVQRVTGSGTATGNLAYSPTGTFNEGESFSFWYDAQFIANGNSVTFFGESLSDYEIQTGGVYITAVYTGAAWIVSKVSTESFGEKELITATIGFDTDEQGEIDIEIPFDFLLEKVVTVVTQELAGTDDGTLAIEVNGSSPTPASQTIPQGSAVGTKLSNAITGTNTGSAGDNITLTSAKTTAGGRVLVQLTVVRIPTIAPAP